MKEREEIILEIIRKMGIVAESSSTISVCVLLALAVFFGATIEFMSATFILSLVGVLGMIIWLAMDYKMSDLYDKTTRS